MRIGKKPLSPGAGFFTQMAYSNQWRLQIEVEHSNRKIPPPRYMETCMTFPQEPTRQQQMRLFPHHKTHDQRTASLSEEPWRETCNAPHKSQVGLLHWQVNQIEFHRLHKSVESQVSTPAAVTNRLLEPHTSQPLEFWIPKGSIHPPPTPQWMLPNQPIPGWSVCRRSVQAQPMVEWWRLLQHHASFPWRLQVTQGCSGHRRKGSGYKHYKEDAVQKYRLANLTPLEHFQLASSSNLLN